jgi:hypothetical protein
MNIYVYIYIHTHTHKHYVTSLEVAGSIPDEGIGFFNLPYPSSRTRNLPGGKGRSACEAENLTAICVPTV